MSVAVGTQPLVVLTAYDHTQDVGNGEVVVVKKDGTVLSIQPDGSQESRPAGTSGPYERAKVNGNLIVYQPIPGKVWAYAFEKDLPNA